MASIEECVIQPNIVLFAFIIIHFLTFCSIIYLIANVLYVSSSFKNEIFMDVLSRFLHFFELIGSSHSYWRLMY